MADFHFLRPLWLLLLLCLPLLFITRHWMSRGDTGWSRYIPPALLQPLLQNRNQAPGSMRRPRLLTLGLGLTLLAVALSGPSWRQAPTPLKQPQDSLVILLDLSLSMLATDVEPNRLTQAKRKIRDILQLRRGGLTALVVYAGDAHTVTPLTEDGQTIEAMLDVLDPTIMPATGNRADLAVARARKLLDQGAPGRGQILLMSDKVARSQYSAIGDTLANTAYRLSTLVVGTTEGGPIPLAKRGFIRDNGEIVISRAEPAAMAELARSHQGQSHELTLNEQDIQSLELAPRDSDLWQSAEDTGLSVNRWQDDGYWLLWAAAPLLLLGWRQGSLLLVAFVLVPLLASPRPAMALDWPGLWQREDQRGPALIEENPASATQSLTSPVWRGAALYRNGEYQAAAQAFARQAGPHGDYNRGNALAKAGDLEAALGAYDKALSANPDMHDARFNRQLVEDLLRQQQAQQQAQNQQRAQGDRNAEKPQPGQQSGDPGDDGNSNSASTPPNSAGSNEASEGQNSQPHDPASLGEDSDGKERNDQTEENTEPSEQARSTAQKPGEDDTADASSRVGDAREQPLTQGQEQWLRRIPDNPGGLLQRKFLQQYQQRQTQPDEGDTPW
ncbi:hypothetical protein C7H09_10955 [Marinobacter fuscus]|uniref:VWFA domain-containing protein n=1 Tax=Marinobacter fuscus TaxID=2109942 RepID=A0A2T1K7L8_9GAMM|nr:VWA domain-containing protein [Marinobacter fuscus]PSF06146.1 hypothetical protein C7H09_10955 [Marinobacter fuscus]